MLPEVNARQELVSLFLRCHHLRADLIAVLRGIGDVTRVVQKFMFRKGDINDLVTVKETIDAWNLIRKRILLEVEQAGVEGTNDWLDWSCILGLLRTMADMEMLSVRINSAIDGTPPRKQDETSGELHNGGEPGVFDPVMLSKRYDAAKTWTIKPRHVVVSWHCVICEADLVPALHQLYRNYMNGWISSMMHGNNWRSG